MELEAVAYGVLVRVVRGLAGRLGGLGGLGGSGCRRVSGEGAASESGLVSKGLVGRARCTQTAGASSPVVWHMVVHTPALLEHALTRSVVIGAGHHGAQRAPRSAPQNYSVPTRPRPRPRRRRFLQQSQGK